MIAPTPPLAAADHVVTASGPEASRALAAALFGGSARMVELEMQDARRMLRDAHVWLAEFDDDCARGPGQPCPDAALDKIATAVWHASHTDTQRQRIIESIECIGARIARLEATVAERMAEEAVNA